MNHKFRNRYRSSSIRLQTWAYRWAGAYFVTICTQKRLPYFGKIETGKMISSIIGSYTLAVTKHAHRMGYDGHGRL